MLYWRMRYSRVSLYSENSNYFATSKNTSNATFETCWITKDISLRDLDKKHFLMNDPLLYINISEIARTTRTEAPENDVFDDDLLWRVYSALEFLECYGSVHSLLVGAIPTPKN